MYIFVIALIDRNKIPMLSFGKILFKNILPKLSSIKKFCKIRFGFDKKALVIFSKLLEGLGI